MKKTILASFIIPVYNAEAYLERCLNSVTAIKNMNIEIILIDDGSTDKSFMMCKKYAKTDDRIIIVKKGNGGVSSARNLGIKIARGEWVSFIDSDDEIVPEVYDNFCAEINRTADMWVLGCTCHNLNRNGANANIVKDVWNEKEIKIIKRGILHQDLKFAKQVKRSGIFFKTCWGKFLQKEVLLQKNIFFPENIGIGEDSIFIFSYLNFTKRISYTTECGYFYRQNGDSVMNRYEKNKGKRCLDVVQEMDGLSEDIGKADFAQFGIRQYLYALKIDWCNPNNPDNYFLRKGQAIEARNSSLIEKAFYYAKLSQIRWAALPLAICAKWKWFFMCNLFLKLKAKFHIVFR